VNTANGRRSRVVLRAGNEGRMSSPDRAALTRLLLERGFEVACSRDGVVSARPDPGGDATIVVQHFGSATSPEPPPGIRVVEAEGVDPPALATMIERVSDAPPTGPAAAWKPWFPVIDYSRCTNCMQCLSFCLFDVYGVSAESKIQVQHQSNCKTDCPACSRVCPEVAIMFPKYRHGPINGEEVKPDDVRREAMKVDISALLGGDVYALLRDRSVKAKSRFSKERDDERALKERQTCLIALQRDLDVPAEVLAALPSPEEIMAKAEAARLRALAASQAANAEAKA
jgi:NAD-dependent dihydropyrimidine dehydrogenase PreA subunit